MSSEPSLTGKDVIAMLRQLGFTLDRVEVAITS